MCLERVDSVEEEGFFSCAVIKKRVYWPEMFPGKEIEDHFWKVEVGDTDAI